MEKTKASMTLRVVISILAAIALWIYVDIGQATTVKTRVRDVPVEFAYENSILADRGLMLLSGYDTTLDLKIEGPRRELWKLDKDAIRIVADTSSITETGVQALNYQVVFPDNVSRNDLKVEASAYTVTVTVGELYTKDVPVVCEIEGELASGFYGETVVLDPAELTLRGQRDDLLNVSYAKIVLDVSGASKTVVQGIAYTLYDYNDVPVENERIRTSTKMIQATMPVYTTKEVPLRINFIETPGSTIDTMDCTIVPGSVTLAGEKAVLDTIDEILLGEIYLQDLKASQTVVYTIPVPAGTTMVSGGSEATATIVVTGVTERTVNVAAFILPDAPEGYQVTAVTESLNILLRGLTKEIEALKAENVIVTADLSGITEAGNYTVPVTVQISGYENVSAKGGYQIIVKVAPATGEPGETGESGESGEAGNG
jgi:YbbR domain-containing protein